MTSPDTLNSAATALYKALRTGISIAPLTDTYENLTINDAYAISVKLRDMRLRDGETIIGKKSG